MDVVLVFMVWMICLDVKVLVFLLSGEIVILCIFIVGFSFFGDIIDLGGFGGGDNEVFVLVFWSCLGVGLFILIFLI